MAEKTFKTKELTKMLEDLSEYCRGNNIPIFIATIDEDTKSETKYLYDCISPKVHGITLAHDIFPDLVNVANGFQTVPPRETLEMDFDTGDISAIPDM